MKTISLHPKGNIAVVALAEVPPFGRDGLFSDHFYESLVGIGAEYVPPHCTELPEGARDGRDVCTVGKGYMYELREKGDFFLPLDVEPTVSISFVNSVLIDGRLPVILLEAQLATIILQNYPTRVRFIPIETRCFDADYIFRMVRVQMNYTPKSLRREFVK